MDAKQSTWLAEILVPLDPGCSARCYFFNSARKLGVASMPICACLEVIVALPGVPGAPLIGSDRWVTCAEYIPSVIVAIRVEAENPVTSVPGLTAAVAVQVMLGVSGTSTGSTNG